MSKSSGYKAAAVVLKICLRTPARATPALRISHHKP